MTDPTPLKDSIAAIGKNGEGFTLEGAADTDGRKELGLEYVKDVGKPGGWSLGAAAEWVGGVGGRIAGRINWKPGGRDGGTK